MLHISQLQDHLHSRRAVRFKDLSFIQTLEQCAEKIIHDDVRKVFYLYEVVCCEMLFKQVNIYYADDQIIFYYRKSCIDLSRKIMDRLEQDEISFFPVRKSFILSC
ncbi:hypothetical protein [Sporosarcina sp. GW1-11]|uniref:hypothetical protein n=1 Tax=Sporosarcina sp. GW1-11 TaxID=2899126 RepID=UPI002955DD9B|nr:hypothetical protein [Sporosarcina sp. GW1-11]